MVELWVVRHGQTDWNLKGWQQGHHDIPLNDVGIRQAIEVADKLSGKVFDAIYSSDLVRAQQTAEVLAATLNLTVQIDQRLREIHKGEWEGMTVPQIIRKYPRRVYDGLRDVITASAPGGETVRQVAIRVIDLANILEQMHSRVLVVSHGITLALLTCVANKQPVKSFFSYVPENTEVRVIRWDGREITID
jgi:broad specificity phosphatase PhoE